jgi:probable rRNA maturation factor
MSNISFVSEEIKFNFPDKLKIKQWIKNTVAEEGSRVGEISIVFCSDEYLLNVNNQYLQHDYYTDIITFDYSEDGFVSGDLMISIDRVKENATIQKAKFEDELHRVIIHGVLHLLGYKDKTAKEEKQMRGKEDTYLLTRP